MDNLVFHPDCLLRTKSSVVAEDYDVGPLFSSMLSILKAANGIGLAAIQIGIPKRAIVIKIDDDPLFLINPEIITISEELSVRPEGCLSIPGIHPEIKRPAKVGIKYQDMNRKVHELEADDLMAACVQHEIDHLNGVLIIDHLSRLKRDMVMKKYLKK